MTVLLENDTVYSFKTKDVKWEGTQEKKTGKLVFFIRIIQMSLGSFILILFYEKLSKMGAVFLCWKLDTASADLSQVNRIARYGVCRRRNLCLLDRTALFGVSSVTA